MKSTLASDLAKEIKHENTGKGWSFVNIGAISLFIAIKAFSTKQFVIRFISAPLCLLFAACFLFEGIRLLMS